jgi:hypothetical protein
MEFIKRLWDTINFNLFAPFGIAFLFCHTFDLLPKHVNLGAGGNWSSKEKCPTERRSSTADRDYLWE